jgi:3-deoxy-D-manno-octulosonic-acid transferase
VMVWLLVVLLLLLLLLLLVMLLLVMLLLLLLLLLVMLVCQCRSYRSEYQERYCDNRNNSAHEYFWEHLDDR